MCQNVTVIIPVYNEEDNITLTINSISQIDCINQIIVVDDGSKDNTYDIVSKIDNILVVKHRKNMGKGNAIKTGLEYADNDYIGLVDGDLRESASEFEKLINIYKKNPQAMIIATFPEAKTKGGFGIVKYISKKGFYTLTSRYVKSILNGQRIMRKNFLNSINIPNGFDLEFKLTLEAVRNNIDIIEVPVNMSHNESQRNIKGFLHRGRQFWNIIKIIAKEAI